jgi:hypothetical protein
MPWLKISWAITLFIVFLSVSAWYGGNGKPVGSEEGEQLLEAILKAYGEEAVAADGLYQNMLDMIPKDDGKEFYAVNLEQLKEGEEARTADAAYANIVFPLLFKRASHPVFVSQRAGLMLGRYGEEVDRVAVVRYRSLRDLLTMVVEPSMVEGGGRKFAALEHTEVFITRPYISFVQVRLVLALILALIGIAGWRLIGWAQSRRTRSS